MLHAEETLWQGVLLLLLVANIHLTFIAVPSKTDMLYMAASSVHSALEQLSYN